MYDGVRSYSNKSRFALADEHGDYLLRDSTIKTEKKKKKKNVLLK